MTDKHIFTLAHDMARQRAAEAVRTAPDGWRVTVEPPKRTLDQNAKQWPYLEGFAQQIQWPVNGVLRYLVKEEWKDILTAAFRNERHLQIAQSLDGLGVVMLGRRTSKMSAHEFREWMAFLKAAAADRGVTPVYSSPVPDERRAA